jgi:hypothetical protein
VYWAGPVIYSWLEGSDQFSRSFKLQDDEVMKLRTCQEHLHAIISEVPHHQRELIDDEYESERDEVEMEPSTTNINLTPAFISEMISLQEQAKNSLLHKLFLEKQEVPFYEGRALLQEVLSVLTPDATEKCIEFNYRYDQGEKSSCSKCKG